MGSNGCDEGGAGLVRDATFFPAGHVLTRTCACACTCTAVHVYSTDYRGYKQASL